MGLIAAKDTAATTPPNTPPEWLSTPSVSFEAGIGGSYDLTQDAFDAEDSITFTTATASPAFPTGISISGTSIVATTAITTAVTSGVLILASDGVNAAVTSPPFNFNVTSLVWPEQGTVSYLPAVRNRNPSNAPVAEGRGFGMDTRHAYSQWNATNQSGTQPTVIHVTNRSATGTGSLRDALEVETGPRIIVFDVGGDFSFSQTIDINDGEVWLAGQTAPTLVNILTGGNRFRVRDGDVLFQHVSVWNDADVNASAPRPDTILVTNTGTVSTFSNVVFDHCFFGGATDEIFNIVYRDKVTLIDSIIAKPRGATTWNHAYGSFIGDTSLTANSVTDVALIGNVWAFNQRRCPFWRCIDGSIVNNLFYECASAGAEIEGPGNDLETTMSLNIVGNRWLDTPSDGEIFLLDGGGAPERPAIDSEFFLYDNFGPSMASASADQWDLVTDSLNQEANIRSNTTASAGWPSGLVAATNTSKTAIQFKQLLTRNVGPRPNSRIAFIQDIIDDVINGTGSIQNDYTAPTVTATTSAFIYVTASAHVEGLETGRTKLEEQLLSLAEGLLS